MERGNNFVKPIKLGDIMKGVTFEINSKTFDDNEQEEIDGMFWTDVDDDDMEKYRNPCSTPFDELKQEMTQVAVGIAKKVLKKPTEGAKAVDLNRTRVTYHRNFYMEFAEHPFDSTYLNGRPDEMFLPLDNNRRYLDGFMEAISTMQNGEHSLFIISYKKMFGPLGCPPRVHPESDILCDIKVLNVEEVGDQAAIDEMLEEESKPRSFTEMFMLVEETRIRASDYFSKGSIDNAVKLYQRIVQSVQFAETEGEKERKDKKDIMLRAMTNLAVCKNKQEEWQEALEYVKMVEGFQNIENQPKLLFAKGRALMKLGEIKEALVFLLKALKLCPGDKQISQSVEECQSRKQNYDSFNKNFAKNLKLT